MPDLAARVADLEKAQLVSDFRLKELEKAEGRRARADYVRDWLTNGGRYFLPLGLAVATFLLGKYG